MTSPAEKLFDHFDRLAGSSPRLTRVSDEDADPRLHVATYRGCPDASALTGFTLGLSHFHPPGGAHKELIISMRDTDDAWALAGGLVAFRLRESCPFNCGDTFNFKEQISPPSRMSAFVAVHPQHIDANDSIVDIGIRQVELMQLIPVYERERSWILGGGDLEQFLDAFGPSELMNPSRDEFIS